MGYDLLLSFILMFTLALFGPVGGLPSDSRVLLTCSHRFLSISLVSAATVCFRLILYFFCSVQESAILPKSPGSFLASNGIYKPIHFSFVSNDDIRELFGMELL